jgi:hypothetical protein
MFSFLKRPYRRLTPARGVPAGFNAGDRIVVA